MSCTALTVDCISSSASSSGSIYWMTMLFGDWVNYHFGETSSTSVSLTPTMVLIGSLNFVALVYSSIITVYNSSMMTLNAAATGTVFGKMSSMVPLRLAVAFALLTPVVAGNGAYVGAAQYSGMGVLTSAVGMADLAWRLYLEAFIQSNNSTKIGNMYNNTLRSGETVTSMLMCSNYMQVVAEDSRVNTGSKYKTKVVAVSSSGRTGRPVYINGDSDYSMSTIVSGLSLTDEISTTQYSSNSAKGRAFILNRKEVVNKIRISFAGGDCGEIELPFSMLPPTEYATQMDYISWFSSYRSAETTMRYIHDMNAIVKQHISIFTPSMDIFNYSSSKIDGMNRFNKKVDISQYVTNLSKYSHPTAKEIVLDTMKYRDFQQLVLNVTANLTACQAHIIKQSVAGDFNSGWGKYKSNCGFSAPIKRLPHSGEVSLAEVLSEGGWIYSGTAFNRLSGLMATATANAMFSPSNITAYSDPSISSFCPNVSSGFFQSVTNIFSGDEVDQANECIGHWATTTVPSALWDQIKIELSGGNLSPNWDIANQDVDWTHAAKLAASSDQTNSGGDGLNVALSVSASILHSLIDLGSGDSSLAASLNNPDEAGVDLDNALFDVSGDTNGLVLLATMGEGLKTIFYIVLGLKEFATASSEAMLNNPVSGILGFSFAVAFKVAASMLSVLLMSALTGAFILTNVLPIMPMVLMVFTAVAFFLLAAEALGGVALGVAMLASASGEGLIAVHGLRMASLYAAIFLRPTLFIVGYGVAFALSNLSIAYLNDIFFIRANIGEGGNGLFDFVMLVGGYPILAFFLITYAFKAISLYANNLMSWLSTHAVGAFGDTSEYLNSSKAAFDRMGGALNSALTSGGNDKKNSGNSDNSKNRNDSSSNDKQSEKPSSTSR